MPLQLAVYLAGQRVGEVKTPCQPWFLFLFCLYSDTGGSASQTRYFREAGVAEECTRGCPVVKAGVLFTSVPLSGMSWEVVP